VDAGTHQGCFGFAVTGIIIDISPDLFLRYVVSSEYECQPVQTGKAISHQNSQPDNDISNCLVKEEMGRRVHKIWTPTRNMCYEGGREIPYLFYRVVFVAPFVTCSPLQNVDIPDAGSATAATATATAAIKPAHLGDDFSY
jgi:hypothetical protein